MKTNFFLSLSIVSTLMLGTFLTSCEKEILDEEEQTKTQKQSKSNVVLRVTQFNDSNFEITDYSYNSLGKMSSSNRANRALTDLTTYCTRLNYVIFKDGKKLEGRSQMKGDTGFGEVAIALLPGNYQLLVLAHSSTGGNPTITNPEKIQFTNDLNYSDTFSFYGNLEVSSEARTHDVVLTRNVSCLRFIVQDDFPDSVKYMKFYYTGGSGVLNAVSGYGASVNSQQEKRVNVQGLDTPLTFNLFTFLQEDEGLLQLKVQALKEDGKTVVLERNFSDIPMKHQRFTSYSGSFFYKSNSFTLMAETDWGEPFWQGEF